MSNAKQNKPVNKTASERIVALEGLIAYMSDQIEMLISENDRNRSLITSLAKRINAAIKAGENGSLSGDAVNKMILDENVRELEFHVNKLVENGILVLDNQTKINERTFVVGREVDSEGNVINPRLQFAVGSVDQSLQTKFLGNKAGDLIKNEDGTSFEITEVYNIVDPKINKEFEEEKEVVEEKATEATPEASGSEK